MVRPALRCPQTQLPLRKFAVQVVVLALEALNETAGLAFTAADQGVEGAGKEILALLHFVLL
jgi:hypothetical protein